jgi:hypothetical protein
MKLILISVIFFTGCSIYTPQIDKVIIQVRSDEAYYAGFFRACEMIVSEQIEGVYSQVNDMELDPSDQCLSMVQQMMDWDAARYYSKSWPGMYPLWMENRTSRVMRNPH